MRNPLETIDGVYNELLKAEARIAELENALTAIRDQQGAYQQAPRDIARNALKESDE